MFFEPGCYGRILLGKLPQAVQERLAALPGEWLEYNAPGNSIEVRLCQPSAAPCVPTIAGELVRMLSEIPLTLQTEIPGGELYVHTEREGQLVRFRIEPGGALSVTWAHPDYAGARKIPFTARETLVQAPVQRLNGCITLETPDPRSAARTLIALADTYEGLYPEGDFIAVPDEDFHCVRIELRDVNLDARLLVEKLLAFGSATGRIEVTSFAAAVPEQAARLLLEGDRVFIERPALWQEQERLEVAGARE